jgi:hypothetical protein
MSIFEVVQSLPLDDSSMSVLAMLVGIVGGWTITSLHQQMKAKRVKLDSQKRMRNFGKPD